jgi:hypothetical protein
MAKLTVVRPVARVTPQAAIRKPTLIIPKQPITPPAPKALTISQNPVPQFTPAELAGAALHPLAPSSGVQSTADKVEAAIQAGQATQAAQAQAEAAAAALTSSGGTDSSPPSSPMVSPSSPPSSPPSAPPSAPASSSPSSIPAPPSSGMLPSTDSVPPPAPSGPDAASTTDDGLATETGTGLATMRPTRLGWGALALIAITVGGAWWFWFRKPTRTNPGRRRRARKKS